MPTCVYGSVVPAGVNAGVRASVGSLVKIKLNEPEGSGLGLSGVWMCQHLRRLGSRNCNWLGWVDKPSSCPESCQSSLYQTSCSAKAGSRMSHGFSVFMWVLCTSVLCVDRCINMSIYILYTVNCLSGISTQPCYWRDYETESKVFSNLNASMIL